MSKPQNVVARLLTVKMGIIDREGVRINFVSLDEIRTSVKVDNNTSDDETYAIQIIDESGTARDAEPDSFPFNSSTPAGGSVTISTTSENDPSYNIDSLGNYFSIKLSKSNFGFPDFQDQIFVNNHTFEIFDTEAEAQASVTDEQRDKKPSGEHCDLWCKVLYYGKKVAIYGGIAIGALIILSAIVKSGRNGGN